MGKIANRPIIDGVQHRECVDCHKVLPEQKPYFSTNGFRRDGSIEYKAKCADCQYKYQERYKKHDTTALVPTETRTITVQDGLEVQVGWHGDAKYWPVKPLAGLCRESLKHWQHLNKVLREDDGWASVVTDVVMTGADNKRYSMTCLPWDRWADFWLSFGGDNPQARAVQDTARNALALVFGDTAESNREAAESIGRGEMPPRVLASDPDYAEWLKENRALALDALRLLEEEESAMRAAQEAEQEEQRKLAESERLRQEAETVRERRLQLQRQAEERAKKYREVFPKPKPQWWFYIWLVVKIGHVMQIKTGISSNLVETEREYRRQNPRGRWLLRKRIAANVVVSELEDEIQDRILPQEMRILGMRRKTESFDAPESIVNPFVLHCEKIAELTLADVRAYQRPHTLFG